MLSNLDAAATLMGGAVTAGSLLFSIWSYRRSQEQQLYSRFRPELANLKLDLEKLHGFVSERGGHEIADNIAAEILALFPGEEIARERLPSFGATDDEKNAIVNAVYAGWLKSQSQRQVRDISHTVGVFPNTYKGQFPIMMSLIEAISFYARSVSERFTGPDIIIEELKDDEQRKRSFEIVVRDATTAPIHSELAIMVSAFQSGYAEQGGNKVLSIAREIFQILERAVSSKSDSALSAFSQRERRLARTKLRPFDDQVEGFNDAREDIAYNIRLLKLYFSAKQWKRLEGLREQLAAE